MPAKLITQNGPDTGRLYVVNESTDTVLGRETDCDLQILHESISRHQAVIFLKKGDYFIKDMNSSNGTFLNGSRVRGETRLKNGDFIRIGVIELRFSRTGLSAKPISREKQKLEDTGTQMLERFGFANPAFLSLDSREKTVEAYEKAHKELATIYDVTHSFLTEENEEAIYNQLVEIIQQVLNPDTVFILLVDKEMAKVEVVRKAGNKVENVVFNQKVVERVLSKGQSIFSNDFANDTRFKGPGSADKSDIESLICVPMESHKRIVGALYLDLRLGAKGFDKSYLELVSAIGKQAGVTIERLRMVEEFEELFLGTIKTLVAAIDAKDRYTFGHSERVTAYAIEIGTELGLSRQEMALLEISGLLHDVGKIGVPENILNKPSGLTPAELGYIRQHPVLGASIVKNIKNIGPVIDGIKYHHENWNGTGYPDGLKGKDIPFFGRIIAIADSYDAMACDRVYRKSMGPEKALDEMERCTGIQFDPDLIKAFLKVQRAKMESSGDRRPRSSIPLPPRTWG